MNNILSFLYALFIRPSIMGLMPLYDPAFGGAAPRADKLPAGEYKKAKVDTIYPDGNFRLTATHNRKTKVCSVPSWKMTAALQNGHRTTRTDAQAIMDNLTQGNIIHIELHDVEVDGDTHVNCMAAKLVSKK